MFMITNQNIELKNVVLHHNCSFVHDNELKYRTKDNVQHRTSSFIHDNKSKYRTKNVVQHMETTRNIEIKNIVQPRTKSCSSVHVDNFYQFSAAHNLQLDQIYVVKAAEEKETLSCIL